MLEMTSMKRRIILACLLLLGFHRAIADEQLWGFVRGAETLPVKRWEAYQFTTLGEGKSEGTYLRNSFRNGSRIWIHRSIPSEPFANPT